MRTVQSERFAKSLLQTLLKQDWEEAAHPRDEGGRFAPSEARRVAEAMLPPAPGSKPLNHPQKSVQGNVSTMLAASTSSFHDYHQYVAKERYLGGGEGESWKIEFKDGSKAVYKPTMGSVIQKKIVNVHAEDFTSIDASIPESTREIAAFQLSRAAGFDVVPPVAKVEFSPMDLSQEAARHYASQGGGHAQAWVDGEEADANTDRLLRHSMENHPDLHRIAALDFITGILDRHEGNFMYGKDGRYYAIDSGLAFCRDQEMGLYNSAPHRELHNAEIPEEVKKEINSISKETLTKIMKDAGFKEPDIMGANVRLEVLKKTKKWGKEEEMIAAAEDTFFQTGGRRRKGYVE